jgi:hypothetical protein
MTGGRAVPNDSGKKAIKSSAAPVARCLEILRALPHLRPGPGVVSFALLLIGHNQPPSNFAKGEESGMSGSRSLPLGHGFIPLTSLAKIVHSQSSRVAASKIENSSRASSRFKLPICTPCVALNAA